MNLVEAIDKQDIIYINDLDEYGNHNLHWTLHFGLDCISDKLIEHKVGINVSNSCGTTPLMIASCLNQEKIVQKLLRFGAKLDVVNNIGETALIIASRYDNQFIVDHLLNAGADPFIKTNKGYTAFTMANNESIRNSIRYYQKFIIDFKKYTNYFPKNTILNRKSILTILLCFGHCNIPKYMIRWLLLPYIYS